MHARQDGKRAVALHAGQADAPVPVRRIRPRGQFAGVTVPVGPGLGPEARGGDAFECTHGGCRIRPRESACWRVISVHVGPGAEELGVVGALAAEALGDPAGDVVAVADQADHARQTQILPGKAQRRHASFGGVAVVTLVGAQHPAQLDIRPAFGLHETDTSDKTLVQPAFHRPHAEPAQLPVPQQHGHGAPGIHAVERMPVADPARAGRVGQHRGIAVEVALRQGSQAQATGFDLGYFGHGVENAARTGRAADWAPVFRFHFPTAGPRIKPWPCGAMHGRARRTPYMHRCGGWKPAATVVSRTDYLPWAWLPVFAGCPDKRMASWLCASVVGPMPLTRLSVSMCLNGPWALR